MIFQFVFQRWFFFLWKHFCPLFHFWSSFVPQKNNLVRSSSNVKVEIKVNSFFPVSKHKPIIFHNSSTFTPFPAIYPCHVDEKKNVSAFRFCRKKNLHEKSNEIENMGCDPQKISWAHMLHNKLKMNEI